MMIKFFAVLGLLAVQPQLATIEAPGPPVAPTGGPHDFDFEFGSWSVRIHRLLRPLTGSTQWIDLAGTSVVRPVWSGRANLGELEVSGSGGVRIEGLSLRLYDPATRQWRIHWANAADGLIGEAMRGGFENGRGLFYDREAFGDRQVTVRFDISEVAPRHFRLEQAFSPDDGKTWEVNWIATFERVDRAR